MPYGYKTNGIIANVPIKLLECYSGWVSDRLFWVSDLFYRVSGKRSCHPDEIEALDIASKE